MTHKPDDLLSYEKLDSAARLVLERRSAARAAKLEEIAAAVVQEVFSPGMAGDRVATQRHLTERKLVLISEVILRVHLILERQTAGSPVADAVDMASDQSFPASDPPGWIWRERRERC